MKKTLANKAFGKIKEYINSKEIDFTFSKKELIKDAEVTPGSARIYIEKLICLHILEYTGEKTYKIKQKIPPEMNTIVLCHLIFNMDKHPSPMDWFMTIEDRVKHLYKLKGWEL